MKKIILLITILAIACSPVRKGYFKYEPEQPSKNKQVNNNKNQNKIVEDEVDDEEDGDFYVEEYEPSAQYSNTFGNVYYPDGESDANKGNSELNNQNRSNKSFSKDKEVISETIVLNSQNIAEPVDIIRDYEDALTQFDMGNYSAAERKLRALSETLKEDDTLTFETKFYIAECHIAKNEFSQALELLKKLNKSADSKSDLKQKTLVRLGQIYCVLNMKKDAEKYFSELKMKYPNSIYNQLGQCK